MKKIKIVVESTFGFPDNTKLVMYKNHNSPFIKMNDLVLSPFIKFDGLDELAVLSDYDIELLDFNKKIEELNADDVGIS